MAHNKHVRISDLSAVERLAWSAIRGALLDSDDLRRPKYRGSRNLLVGHCYMAAEALYHALGGKASGLTPCSMRVQGDMHWFLRHRIGGDVLDPTAEQFGALVPNYAAARGRGFMTREPSKRAAELLRRAGLVGGRSVWW